MIGGADVPRRAAPRLTLRRASAILATLAIVVLILRRVPAASLVQALRDADLGLFLPLMIANTLFYFAWDTLVLAAVVRWFHGPVPYRELLAVRAASYVAGFFNTNIGRGALAAYLSRRLRAPFLELGSTVLFLVLTEYTQLVIWSMLGLFGLRAEVSRSLLLVAGGVAAGWLLVRLLLAPRDWPVARTFRLATPERYVQIVLLRAPMFFVSLCLHYYAAHAFGIHIPFAQLLTFLPVIFMLAALPVTVAHLGTTQAAWVFFFGAWAPAPRLLAFSLAAHLVFTATRALAGAAWMPAALVDITTPGEPRPARALLGSVGASNVN
jgi:lysylphosphatidylglycerol synthase-like protein